MSSRIEERALTPGLTVITLEGEIDLYDAPRFKELLLGAIASGSGRVICDLTAVTFIDSTTLGVLLQGKRRLAGVGGALHVVCPTPAIVNIFRIVGLHRILTIHSDLPAAIAALSGPGGPR